MRKVFATLTLIFAALTAPVARAEPVTVAALGDSLTQGYGLPQGQGFVPQLAKWLESNGHEAVLINAGVSGDTTAGGAARVAWTLTPDVQAMIVTLGGNDLLRGIDPGVARTNLDTILQTAWDQGVPVLLIGMRAPGNYGPEYKARFEANYADLAKAYGALFLPDFMAGLVGEGGDPAAARPYLQGDGIHPNAEGVARIVAHIGPKVAELIALARETGQQG